MEHQVPLPPTPSLLHKLTEKQNPHRQYMREGERERERERERGGTHMIWSSSKALRRGA
ncbi:unnamed protein product [Spirodela intermedia]|uniref:Uncharacterized protein n=1 Tax=Spirodela intermedia TaxID=51605 RepID=A0A7I8LCM1_SPIIN|nr:unnamed protein product [Spirodela intermedia]